MTTIQIADDASLRPTQSHNYSTGLDIDDGIYSMRAVSKAPSTGRRSRTSMDSHNVRAGDRVLTTEDEDPGLRRAEDYKTKQIFKGRALLWLSYQSIGVIYGDIGTSPLYVFSSTFKAPPSYRDLVGVLSVIIWSLTMMVTIKYVLVILNADNDGEGGTFSTYSLLSRYINITNRDPREASLIQMKRYLSRDLESAGRYIRHKIEKGKITKAVLKVMGVLAVSMVMSDGVLTPAQSVLGAVQGLEVVDSNISNSTVVGVTAAILIILFLIQPLGTTKLATTFAPIVIIWLGFNAVFGVYNLSKHDHSVLKAFNPGYAFEFLARRKTEGWKMLGGVLLAFTGVEALFADLGAFSKRAIQLSWLCYTFPCLLLAYIGQAAYISDDRAAYTNPFYNAAPPGALYPALVVAILAAIVASQAIITATFQLLAQIMKLSYVPQIKVVHTSRIFHGQLYVPMINWLLMIGTVLVASIYNNTTSLGNAYGVCVMFVTFFDTCMVSLAAIFVWRINPFLVFFPWLVISCLDGLYLSSALTKVPDGAWFTLTLAALLAAIFILWRFGKEQQWAAEAGDRFPTSHFVRRREDNQIQLADKYGNSIITPVKGFGIFFDKAGETTPIVFSQFVVKLIAVPEVMVFFHLRPLETPSVAPEKRCTVSRLAIPNCYRLIVRHGYLDEVITPDLASLIYEQIRASIIARHRECRPFAPVPAMPDQYEEKVSVPASLSAGAITENPVNVMATSLPSNAKQQDDDCKDRTDTRSNNRDRALDEELAKLDAAFAHQVLYIIGKEQLKVKANARWFRKAVLHIFLWLRENTRTKIANLRVPTDKVLEVGFIKEV